MTGPASLREARLVAGAKASAIRFGSESTTEAGDKGTSKGAILEIEREGIVDDTCRPGGRT